MHFFYVYYFLCGPIPLCPVFRLNHHHNGTPVNIKPMPIAASRGREIMVFTKNATENKITIAGTMGYPQTL